MDSHIVFVNASNATQLAPLKKKDRELMTQSQLDTQFPVQTYLEWTHHQQTNGLPSEGGVSDETAQVLEREITRDSGILCLSPTESTSGDTCAICLEVLHPTDSVRALSCHHVYHSECILPWFTTRRAICPLCKHNYYTPPASNEPSSPSSAAPTSPRTSSSSSRASIQNPRLAADNSPQLMYPWEYPEIRSTGYNTLTGPSGTMRRMIGTTGVSYEPPSTAIVDDIRLEIKDLMSRIRRSKLANHSNDSRSNSTNSSTSVTDDHSSVSPPPSESRNSPPIPSTRQTHPFSSDEPRSRENSPPKSWKFWKKQPVIS